MFYSEYLRCADKHLKSCSTLLSLYQADPSNDFEVLCDLYYLSGYILEGITIHTAYKINQWPSNHEINDIRFYDLAFVNRTNMDFFHYRRINGQVIPNHGLKVQGHNFQQIARSLLINQGPFGNDNVTPYFGNGPLSPQVLQLINCWQPEMRYLYRNQSNNSSMPVLTYPLMEELVNACKTIFQQTITLVGI